jgi:hypothetical protein
MASQSTLDILSKCKFENPVAFATTKIKMSITGFGA